MRAVKDLIPKYMNELNAISDDLSKELISRFKTLNYMLERMWYITTTTTKFG